MSYSRYGSFLIPIIGAIGSVISSIVSSKASEPSAPATTPTQAKKEMNIYELLALKSTFEQYQESKFDKYMPVGLLIIAVIAITSMTISAKGG